MMVCVRGHVAQHGASGDNVFDELLGAGIVEPAFVFQPGDRVLHLGLDSIPRNGSRRRKSAPA